MQQQLLFVVVVVVVVVFVFVVGAVLTRTHPLNIASVVTHDRSPVLGTNHLVFEWIAPKTGLQF